MPKRQRHAHHVGAFKTNLWRYRTVYEWGLIYQSTAQTCFSITPHQIISISRVVQPFGVRAATAIWLISHLRRV
jgi:hypothetical protein